MKNDQIEKYWTFSSPVKFTSKEKYLNTGCVIDSSDFEVKILFCEILTLEFGRYQVSQQHEKFNYLYVNIAFKAKTF